MYSNYSYYIRLLDRNIIVSRNLLNVCLQMINIKIELLVLDRNNSKCLTEL